MQTIVSSFKTFAFALVVITLTALCTGHAYGQAISGNLVGTVIDSSSAVVTNANVEAMKVETGVITTTTTGSTGAYRFDNLPAGTYRITVRSTGFKTAVQQVDVVLNQTGTLNLTLALGATNETIEVSGVATTTLTQRPRSCKRRTTRVSPRIWDSPAPAGPVPAS